MVLIKEWGYEKKYDLLGILVKDYKKDDWKRTIELKTGFVIDILKDGTIGAIEILGWAQSCKVRPHQVKDMKIYVDIDVGEFSVKVTVTGEYKDKTHKIWGYCYK